MEQLGKIRQHYWKGRLKMSKIAKFESDTSLASEDPAPQSRESLQALVLVLWEGEGGEGGGARLYATIQTSVKFHDFEELYLY